MTELDSLYLKNKAWEDFNFSKPYFVKSIWFDRFRFVLPKHNDILNADSIFVWSDSNVESLEHILINKKINLPIVVFEDTFIRSVDLYRAKYSMHYNENYCMPYGFTWSNYAHYDIRGHGRLESMLTDKFVHLNQNQIDRARNCINKIVSNGLSKYNNQHKEFKADNSDYKILIVDQALGDQSVKLSNANCQTFELMLNDALKKTDNVYIKIHPEQLVGRRKGHFNFDTHNNEQVLVDKQNYPSVKIINDYVNPISLIEQFDEVWTVSSQLGFEALMLNKSVVCYGTPFYSGYGLTDDRNKSSAIEFRRTFNNLTVEDIFYNAYISYSDYYNPFNCRDRWQLEDVLDHLILSINRFQNDTSGDK